MGKHAYLIMAHNQPELLKILLGLLDDERNDIFLHLDIKCNYNMEDFKKSVSKSKLYFVDRQNVHWGGYSLVKAEIELLKLSINVGKYDYYHLISGADLPIKTQDYIHSFFDKHHNKQFVAMDDDVLKVNMHRVKYYWMFQEKCGYQKKNIYNVINKIFICIQKLFKVNRIKESTVEYGLGSNWSSITDSFARYIVKNEEYILDLFLNTVCSDEMFIQTLILQSPYKKDIFSNVEPNIANMRYICFENDKASPINIGIANIEEILASDFIFARKFDLNTHEDAVKIVVNYLVGECCD